MASVPRSAHILRVLVTGSGLFSLIGACGGRSDTRDYVFNADGTISEGASSNSGASSSFGGTPSAGGTNNGHGGTISHGGVSNTGATGPNGGTGVVVGGSGPIAGATAMGGSAIGGTGFGGTGFGGTGFGGSPTAGAAGAPPFTPITCGAQVCDANTESCCAGLGGLNCIAQNQDCNGAVLGCTTNGDCAGNGVCCISITGDVNAASTCKARCNNMGTGRDRQLCQTAADCLDPFRFCTATIFGLNICTRRP
jgi:hypothetical protein